MTRSFAEFPRGWPGVQALAVFAVLGCPVVALGADATTGATALAGAAGGTPASAPVTVKPPSYPQIDKVAFEDFSWVPRALKKEPAYKSRNVRYCIWVLGAGRKSVMTMAWDESEGAGKGYDTLYVDTNFNGDLTEEGKRLFWESPAKSKKQGPFENYVVREVKEADGDRVFGFRFRDIYKDDEIQYDSEYKVSYPGGGYTVGPLPGDLLIQWSNELKTAPVYRFGGTAIPTCNGKLPGESLGTWPAGRMAEAGIITAHWGDRPGAQLRFYGSIFPGLPEAVRANRWGTAAYPFVLLRVLKSDGSTIEEIPFADGCPCAGGFAPGMTIPYRVPPGKHAVVVRMLRQEIVGGPADFLFPVEISNPDYGKPLKDPAYEALKAKFAGGQVKFAALRRAGEPGETAPAYPDEKVVPARVYDNTIDPTNRDWDSTNANFGGDRFFTVGTKPWYHAPSRTLLKVDLAGFPKEAKIVGAQLRLAIVEGQFKAGARIDAYGLRRDWIEAPSAEGFSCWRGPKYAGRANVAWTKPGADDTELDRYPSPAGSTAVGEFPARLDPSNPAKDAPREVHRIVSLDLSELAVKWHGGEVANNGVILLAEGEGNVNIASSEFADYPFRPTLVVAYQGPDPAPTYIVAPEEDLDKARALAKSDNLPLLLRFYSPACVVCRRVQATTFADERVKRRLARQYRAVNLKIEAHADLAGQLGVSAVPAVVVLEPNGKTLKGRIDSQVLQDAKLFLDALEKLEAPAAE